MSGTNIYAANPIDEEEYFNSSKRGAAGIKKEKIYDKKKNGGYHGELVDVEEDDDNYTIKPKIQKNNKANDTPSIQTENDVRTLLNPVLIENKEDNEFSKFDDTDKDTEGGDDYEKNDDIINKNYNNNNNKNNVLEENSKPVKMNSTSSVSTLGNEEDMEGKNDITNEKKKRSNSKSSSKSNSPRGSKEHIHRKRSNSNSNSNSKSNSPRGSKESIQNTKRKSSSKSNSPRGSKEHIHHHKKKSNSNEEVNEKVEKKVEEGKVEKKIEEKGGEEKGGEGKQGEEEIEEGGESSILSTSNPYMENGGVRRIRRSLTDADIIYNLDRKSTLNNSMKGSKDNVDRKYRSINCIQEENMNENNDFNYKKEFKSINLLLGPGSINRSMELFLSKQKSKNSRSGTITKYEVENTNFVNISRKKLDHLLFTSDDSESVRRIDASNNYLSSLPPNIGIFEYLVELDVSNNELKDIPTEIGYLKNLNVLNLNYNGIESLPFQIGGLKNLKFFYVSNNQLTTFPREINMLQNLEGLYASNNRISKLPVEFIRLQKLKALDLCNNLLFCFKFKLSLLKKLEKLYLSNNQFPKFPDELAQMSNLCELYMDGNRLLNLPEEINQMKRLKILRLNDNKIQKIPDGLCELKKLRILRLQNNLIRCIPNKISMLKNLREFNIDFNIINEVPDSMALLPKLRKISYEGNNFSPEEMEKRIFAISTLEFANNEYIQRYCYRPARNSIVQKAIDNINNGNNKNNNNNANNANNDIMDTIQEEEPNILTDETKQDTAEPMAPSIPVMVPETVVYNNGNNDSSNGVSNSNDLIEFPSIPKEKNSSSDQQFIPLNQKNSSSNEIKSNSNSKSLTNASSRGSPSSPGSPDSPDSLDKTKSSGSKKEESSLMDIQNHNNNTVTDNDETLASGSDNINNRSSNDLMKSQESIKLKLIDVVLPEDLTSSQSNFIFEYEDSTRSSQPNLTDVQQSQSMDSSLQVNCQNSTQTGLNSQQNSIQITDRSNSDSLEKKMFKKKYKQHGPSKLGGEPLSISNEDEDDDENQNQNKFAHLAMGSMELLHEKLKH